MSISKFVEWGGDGDGYIVGEINYGATLMIATRLRNLPDNILSDQSLLYIAVQNELLLSAPIEARMESGESIPMPPSNMEQLQALPMSLVALLSDAALVVNQSAFTVILDFLAQRRKPVETGSE